MFIFLEAGTPADVVKKIHLAVVENIGPNAVLVSPETYSFASGEYVFGVHRDENGVHTRWENLYSASKGGRLFSDTADQDNPLFAGPVPITEIQIRRTIAEATYAKGRAEYFSSFGVNYVGRVSSDPRTLVVLDNKGKNKVHSSKLDSSLECLYNSLPTDWWGSAGFVSTGNVDRLKNFVEELYATTALAYSDGGIAKLKHLDVVHATIPKPPSQVSLDYGIKIREVANRLSNT